MSSASDMYKLECTKWVYGYQPHPKFEGSTGTLDGILKKAVDEFFNNPALEAVLIKRKKAIDIMAHNGKGGYKFGCRGYEWRTFGVVAKVRADWPDKRCPYRYIWIPNKSGAVRDLTPKSYLSIYRDQ